MILVTGATGSIGTGLVSSLTRSGESVRALSRSSSSARAAESLGAQAAPGDFDDAHSLELALRGCDTLFLLSPPVRNQASREEAAIKAAVSSGVKRVVKLSAADADLESKVPWARHHAEVEEYLAGAEIGWTILRPTAFMQNFLGSSHEIAEGRLVGITGQGKASYVDARDVTAAAARVLREEGHDGMTYVLTGPESLAGEDVALRFSRVLGKRVAYMDVTEDDLRRKLEMFGVDRWMIGGLLEQYKVISSGLAVGVTDDLSRLLNRDPRSLSEFASDYREVFLDSLQAG